MLGHLDMMHGIFDQLDMIRDIFDNIDMTSDIFDNINLKDDIFYHLDMKHETLYDSAIFALNMFVNAFIKNGRVQSVKLILLIHFTVHTFSLIMKKWTENVFIIFRCNLDTRKCLLSRRHSYRNIINFLD